jgi:hypothetical protein
MVKKFNEKQKQMMIDGAQKKTTHTSTTSVNADVDLKNVMSQKTPESVRQLRVNLKQADVKYMNEFFAIEGPQNIFNLSRDMAKEEKFYFLLVYLLFL